MPKTRSQKEQVLEDLINDIKQAKSAAIASFLSMPVNLDQQFRQQMYENDVSYHVIKKTLIKKAFGQLGFDNKNIDGLHGNISVAASKQDEVSPAKIIKKFTKENESLSIVGGILEQEWIGKEKVEHLASLPTKDELIATTVRTIKAPLNGFANVLAGNLRGLINVLVAVKESKSQ